MFDPPMLSKDFVGRLLQAEPRLYAYIRAQVRERADAEDVLQETVLAMWSGFTTFKPDTNFLGWAYAIAKNKVMDYHRKHARQRQIFNDKTVLQIAAEAEAMADELEGLQEALHGCLGKLRPADRDVVQHCYGTDATVASVAAELGRPTNTIKAILKRCRRALYDCIRRTLAREERR